MKFLSSAILLALSIASTQVFADTVNAEDAANVNSEQNQNIEAEYAYPAAFHPYILDYYPNWNHLARRGRNFGGCGWGGCSGSGWGGQRLPPTPPTPLLLLLLHLSGRNIFLCNATIHSLCFSFVNK